jgi:DinB superfamily
MKQIATELKAVVNEYATRMSELQESEWTAKTNSAKWSKKEVLGHLIDSALNNQRRFVVTQYVQNQNIVYDQDQWVALQDYQNADTLNLIQLWRLLNLQIARILEMMPEPVWDNPCDTGKNGPEFHSLEWLASDYIPHMRHHLGQI